LVDDLVYRTYSNMGRAAFRPLPKQGFVYARLVPIGPVPDAWLVSGSMRAYRKSDAAQVAQAALELATRLPELVHRNPGKVEQAWQQMRAGRGTDQRLLPAPAGNGARRAARSPSAAEYPRRGCARV
jgi:hypothetical protein